MPEPFARNSRYTFYHFAATYVQCVHKVWRKLIILVSGKSKIQKITPKCRFLKKAEYFLIINFHLNSIERFMFIFNLPTFYFKYKPNPKVVSWRAK